MWNNCSVQKTKRVWDILSTVSKVRGLSVGYDLDELLKGRAEAVLDCGQKVLDDESIWDSMPRVIKPSQKEVAESFLLLEEIRRVATSFNVGATSEDVLSGYEAGQNSQDLRRSLQSVLDESR